MVVPKYLENDKNKKYDAYLGQICRKSRSKSSFFICRKIFRKYEFIFEYFYIKNIKSYLKVF